MLILFICIASFIIGGVISTLSNAMVKNKFLY